MEMVDLKKRENSPEATTSKPHENALQDFDPPPKLKKNKFAFACAFVASMASALLGYDIGVMSGAAIYIKKDFKITDVQVEILVGILNLYTIVGSIIAGRTSDWIGRRYTMMIAGIVFFAGAILMGFATNYAFLMCGRFVAGLGVGFGFMIAPVYTTEVSPAAYRGLLASFPEIFINLGILLGFIANFAFSKLPVNLGWRLMLGVGAIPAVLLAVLVLFMFESPRWLVMQGRVGEAKRVLQSISESQEEVDERLADIKQTVGIPLDNTDDVVEVQVKQSQGQGVWKEMLLRPTSQVRHILVACLGLHIFQQLSGIDAVVLYSPRIFEKAGITSDDGKLLATIAVGFVKTMCVLVATFLLDRVGRRPLLLTSVAGVVISLATLGFSLTIIDQSQKRVSWAVGLSMASVLSYVATFSVGLGPIAMVYSCESFPLKLRAQGVSLGSVLNRCMTALVSMTFLSLYKAITIGGAFFLFASIALVAWFFFYFLLPETQGKTLEEVENLFGNLKWKFAAKKNDEAKVV